MKRDNDKLSKSENNEQQIGEDHMVVDSNKLEYVKNFNKKQIKISYEKNFFRNL